MIFTKSQIYKLLFITLALCCLITAANASKLPISHIQTNANGTDIAAAAKAAEVFTTETAVAAIKETENKSSEEDDDEEDDSDTAAKDDDDDGDDDEDETAEKNAVQPAADTSLSVWGIVRGFWNWIREDISESLFGDDVKTSAVTGRTFGKIRRLQMALIPIVFKFGVLTAMVAFLVAIGLKTLFLVKVLIAMNVLAIMAKFFTLKTHFGHVEHVAAHPPSTWNWTPYASSGWQSAPAEQHHSNKEIHLHIHGGHVQPQVTGYSYGNNAGASVQSHGWERRNDPYSAYNTMALQGQQNELLPNALTSNAASEQQFSENYSTNHKIL